jgi:hypothetical protein
MSKRSIVLPLAATGVVAVAITGALLLRNARLGKAAEAGRISASDTSAPDVIAGATSVGATAASATQTGGSIEPPGAAQTGTAQLGAGQSSADKNGIREYETLDEQDYTTPEPLRSEAEELADAADGSLMDATNTVREPESYPFRPDHLGADWLARATQTVPSHGTRLREDLEGLSVIDGEVDDNDDEFEGRDSNVLAAIFDADADDPKAGGRQRG